MNDEPAELVGLTLAPKSSIPLWCPRCGAERATFELVDGDLVPAASAVVADELARSGDHMPWQTDESSDDGRSPA